jgi:antirestriction protein ArdC
MTQQAFTAETAVTFERRSAANAEALDVVASLKGCQCAPYVDWFTYRRWQAQGMQVQRGEKGTKLPIFYDSDEKDKDGNEIKRKRRSSAHLFCRCQVQAKGD